MAQRAFRCSGQAIGGAPIQMGPLPWLFVNCCRFSGPLPTQRAISPTSSAVGQLQQGKLVLKGSVIHNLRRSPTAWGIDALCRCHPEVAVVEIVVAPIAAGCPQQLRSPLLLDLTVDRRGPGSRARSACRLHCQRPSVNLSLRCSGGLLEACAGNHNCHMPLLAPTGAKRGVLIRTTSDTLQSRTSSPSQSGSQQAHQQACS
mmetsp:Transcript_47636/g.111454  ORF Transcript_47636/g.111454 Transcript_47636/m.111454 type:complete len:202 (-) Transcript_47636:300-905(-)